MKAIFDKYNFVYSFYYHINKKYYKTGHTFWTNINCYVVNAGVSITIIFSFILLFGIEVTSETLINIAIFILMLDSFFIWFYTKHQSNLLLKLKEIQVELTPGMKIIHFLSMFLSYILPNFLYTLCLKEEFIW